MADELFLVWAIDDSPSVLDMVRTTLDGFVGDFLQLDCFSRGEDAIHELDLRKKERLQIPSLILMDYYLGTTSGQVLTRAIRLKFPILTGPIIVGHSSMPGASQAIVDEGGDFTLPKPKGSVSQPLRYLLSTRERTEYLLEHRQPMVNK